MLIHNVSFVSNRVTNLKTKYTGLGAVPNSKNIQHCDSTCSIIITKEIQCVIYQDLCLDSLYITLTINVLLN
jgi:hypothetical protein